MKIHLPFAANCRMRSQRHVPQIDGRNRSRWMRIASTCVYLADTICRSCLLISIYLARAHDSSDSSGSSGSSERPWLPSQSINGRVLLIELPTNSVFMRLRRRVHCGPAIGMGLGLGVGVGLGLGVGLAAHHTRLAANWNRKPANWDARRLESLYNLQRATTSLRLLTARNPSWKAKKYILEWWKNTAAAAIKAENIQSRNLCQALRAKRPSHYFDF